MEKKANSRCPKNKLSIALPPLAFRTPLYRSPILTHSSILFFFHVLLLFTINNFYFCLLFNFLKDGTWQEYNVQFYSFAGWSEVWHLIDAFVIRPAHDVIMGKVAIAIIFKEAEILLKYFSLAVLHMWLAH